MKENHYRHLLIMTILSFVSMYILMYAMVDRIDNVYNSVNQLYMAALMTAPMVLIELFVMRGMYHDQKWNGMIIVAALIAGVGALVCIRAQAGVSDRQFLRSMIPHHAGAILMCHKANISDAEIAKLCETIAAGQRQEIDQMKAILSRLP